MFIILGFIKFHFKQVNSRNKIIGKFSPVPPPLVSSLYINPKPNPHAIYRYIYIYKQSICLFFFTLKSPRSFNTVASYH